MERYIDNTLVLEQNLILTKLVIAEGGSVQGAGGKLVTLTVDGIHRDIAPGTFEGNVVLSVTDPVNYETVNYGNTESFQMNAAVSVRDGRYVAGESVAAAQQAGEIREGEANGLRIRSEGDNFGGIYIDGSGYYEVNDADIALNGHGASDGVGYGAGIAVRGNSEVVINRAQIHNVGSIRTALQVCGHAKVTVNDSEFSAADDDRPNYVQAMSKAPWMLGIHGRVRTTNIQDYGEVTYNRCRITAENWGAMSTDGTQHVRMRLYDSEVVVTGCGYGAYSIGDCHDYFNHCKISTPDYGVIQCSGARVTYTGGTTVYAGRSAVMMHGEGGAGLLRIDDGSRIHTAGPAIQVKGRGSDIEIDNAVLESESSVLLQIIPNDDPNGRGMHLGPETVMDVPPGGFPDGGPGDPMLEQDGSPEGPDAGGGPQAPEDHTAAKAVITGSCLQGDIIHCDTAMRDAEIILSGSTLTGRISTGVSSHPAGMPLCKEDYALIGRVEMYPCPTDHAYGISVKLENRASWAVSGTSFLTGLTVDDGCTVECADLTVNGVRIPVQPGSYSGKIVLQPQIQVS